MNLQTTSSFFEQPIFSQDTFTSDHSCLEDLKDPASVQRHSSVTHPKVVGCPKTNILEPKRKGVKVGKKETVKLQAARSHAGQTLIFHREACHRRIRRPAPSEPPKAASGTNPSHILRTAPPQAFRC